MPILWRRSGTPARFTKSFEAARSAIRRRCLSSSQVNNQELRREGDPMSPVQREVLGCDMEQDVKGVGNRLRKLELEAQMQQRRQLARRKGENEQTVVL